MSERSRRCRQIGFVHESWRVLTPEGPAVSAARTAGLVPVGEAERLTFAFSVYVVLEREATNDIYVGLRHRAPASPSLRTLSRREKYRNRAAVAHERKV